MNGEKEDKSVKKTGAEKKSNPENKPTESEQAEILENLPPEAKQAIEMMISMQSISGRTPNPLISKINEEHITKILDQSAKEEENLYKDAQLSKIYALVYTLLIICLIIFLVVFLSGNNKPLLTAIMDKALYALAGFGGGYGLKAYQDSKSKK